MFSCDFEYLGREQIQTIKRVAKVPKLEVRNHDSLFFDSLVVFKMSLNKIWVL